MLIALLRDPETGALLGHKPGRRERLDGYARGTALVSDKNVTG